MPTESLAKRNVTSGTVTIRFASGDVLEVPIPVAKEKRDEAEPLMEDVFRVVIAQYNKTKNMNPRDVSNVLRQIADAFERYQLTFTEDKYNAKARIPRT